MKNHRERGVGGKYKQRGLAVNLSCIIPHSYTAWLWPHHPIQQQRAENFFLWRSDTPCYTAPEITENLVLKNH